MRFPNLPLLVLALTSVPAFGQTEILVVSNITVDTTWTADNVYNLVGQIYVESGAMLTIEAGTVVASDTGAGGGLAVTRGSQIFALGTADDPIIMTSKADVATWTGGDPKTGDWREAANEWGNLALLGDGYVSSDLVATNVPTCSASNVDRMVGLVPAFPGDTRVLYGGGFDDDDSGTLRYVSLRYAGRAASVASELPALALGGVGRETDIDHVEVMNGVDDGIALFGGTVGLKHFSVWNVGDDSFDVDRGWRGRAQFGLLVQGCSLDAVQGSGVGDNAFEFDGANDSHWQPVTTATIYNCTVIGQPVSGDHASAWRDNARVQLRGCSFQEVGAEVVRFDDPSGGGMGYGWAGTLSWPQTWSTPSSQTSLVNPCADPAARYQAQEPGMLAEVRDSVFAANLAPGLTPKRSASINSRRRTTT